MKRGAIFLCICAVVLIAVPLVIRNEFYINLASQILIYALLAVSLNLLLGYGGMVSLGHASFLGLTAYATTLFFIWGAGHFWAAVAAVMFSTLCGALFGVLALRASGIGFLMITLALGQIVWGIAYRANTLTDGDNGLRFPARPQPFGIDITGAPSFYWFTLIVFAIALFVIWRLTGSPFGAALQGARDQPRRMRMLGHNVWLIQWLAFVAASFWGSDRGTTLRLLQPFHLAARDLTAAIGRSAADGDPRRRIELRGPDRRRGDHHAGEERRLVLRRPLEHTARRDLRHRHPVHAVRHRARRAAIVGALAARAEERRGRVMTPALEVTRLNKRFGGLPATKEVSLTVMPGERRLIIGPNGAGKTTLFNLVTGDLTPDAGSVKLFGQELLKLPTQQRVHLGLARTYQILTLFPKETLVHNVVLALLGLDQMRWNPWIFLSGQRALYDAAHEALAMVGLGASAERAVAETSYGERRRLEMAMALAQKPKVLLLDEPLAGLSQEERGQVRALLAKVPRDVTIVMIEHDMDSALAFAERITLLHYGEVIVEGTRAEVVADPRTKEVYLGE